jgi:hypothetical protein
MGKAGQICRAKTENLRIFLFVAPIVLAQQRYMKE